MGCFCPKYTRFGLQKYRGVIFHDTDQWCKIWINPNPVVLKMTLGIDWTYIRVHKSLKNCSLMGSFCPKHIMFQIKFHKNHVSWHWRMTQNLKENWLMAWKMTSGIWLIFIRAVESLKICTLLGSFCPKHTKF